MWRRCEEGGGPRKEPFDSDNVRALSNNEASRIHHFPLHYAADERPQWSEYLRARGLPATAQQHAEEWFTIEEPSGIGSGCLVLLM